MLIVVLSNQIAFHSVQLHACSVRSSIMNWSLYRHDSLLFYCCISCNVIGRLSVENLGLWNFSVAWSQVTLKTSLERKKLTFNIQGFWHFNTVNNKNWGLICVDFCFHQDIFDVVLHLKSVKKGVRGKNYA